MRSWWCQNRRFYSHLLDKGQALVSAVVEEIISDVSSLLRLQEGRSACRPQTATCWDLFEFSYSDLSIIWLVHFACKTSYRINFLAWYAGDLVFWGVWSVLSSFCFMWSSDFFILFLLVAKWAILFLGSSIDNLIAWPVIFCACSWALGFSEVRSYLWKKTLVSLLYGFFATASVVESAPWQTLTNILFHVGSGHWSLFFWGLRPLLVAE